MIDLQQYRCSIGQFCQKISSKNFLFSFYKFESESSHEKLGRQVLSGLLFSMKLLMCIVLTSSVCLKSAGGNLRSCSLESDLYHSLGAMDNIGMVVGMVDRVLWWNMDMLGNFWARYLNGNIQNNTGKGILNIHFNIRHLKYKITEVKNIIKEQKPHLIGLSECEISRDNIDLNDLKIPGYDILFPKSWNIHGFARVVAYVKKSLHYQQVLDLEDNLVQSIWLRGGFKNGKQIYFCHAYREHSSDMGDTIAAQAEYLKILLGQWEAATEHNFANEPNEVHVALDMNLDYSKWLQPSYRLSSLTNLVQDTCNTNNFSQLVSEPTRIMYNSVNATTEISCIDHVYCNSKYKCSTPAVISSGASDHDMVSYIRYSKPPPSPARTIRRRSYKHFNEEDFITDMGAVDWTDVYRSEDVDTATQVFTRKFVEVLNEHAPWVLYQKRKCFSPWLTEDTKNLMNERDMWKRKAKELAILNTGTACEEQKRAWEKFKQLRNSVNNKKRYEELNYKREKMSENIGDPAKMWKTSKLFMNWRSPGSPTQLEVNNSLVTRACLIASHMNQFFIDKVRQTRSSMAQVVINLGHCRKIMETKQCGLRLQHVSEQKVMKLIKKIIQQ